MQQCFRLAKPIGAPSSSTFKLKCERRLKRSIFKLSTLVSFKVGRPTAEGKLYSEGNRREVASARRILRAKIASKVPWTKKRHLMWDVLFYTIPSNRPSYRCGQGKAGSVNDGEKERLEQ